ncbi:MAG: hypothetical protein ACXVJD_00205 [Mucilaginibacter sp.]
MADFVIPLVVLAIIGFIIYKTFGGVFKQLKNQKRLAKEGTLSVAYVKSISQTGTTVNQRPEMLLSLEIENIGGRARQVSIKQLIDLGSIPRVGDRVYVIEDPEDPDNVILSPQPFGNGVNVQTVDNAGKPAGTVDLGNSQIKDFMALSPELRERGMPGVATVVSVMPSTGRTTQITIDIDNIGQPLKRATITQIIDGQAPVPGTRLYFLYDPKNPDHMALSPANLNTGQNLGTMTNRLDPLVLGPQLLKSGAKTEGTVVSANSIDLSNPMLATLGYSKWDLVLNVKPQNGTDKPYQANLTITLTSKEKADKIAYTGATVPLRYDPLDLQTVSIDSIAMGYPDPYETVIKAFSDQMNKQP